MPHFFLLRRLLLLFSFRILWLSCRIFSVLSAILYLGNVTYRTKSTGRDEGLDVGPPEVLATLSELLKVTLAFVFHATPSFTESVSFNLCASSQVKEELLIEALTKRKTVTVNDKLILPYSHSEVDMLLLY